MSTPPESRGGKKPSPKTPGWSHGLFGIFSTAKKPNPVGRSILATEKSPGAHFPSSSKRTSMEITLTPPSERQMGAANTNSAASPFGDLLAGTGQNLSPLEHSTLASYTMMAKSPWKSPAANGTSVAAVSLRAGSSSKDVPKRAARRTKVYRPNSIILGAKRRRTGPVDPAYAHRVLQLSKSMFEPTTRQIQARQNYESFKPGKRLLGSNQSGSRLPSSLSTASATEVPSTDRGVVEASERKKVSFGSLDKPVETEVYTPIRAETVRKLTPYKPRHSVDEAESAGVASPGRSAFPRFPVVDLVVKPPFNDFGTEDELEQLGPPVPSQSRREIFDYSIFKKGPKRQKEMGEFFDTPDLITATEESENTKRPASEEDDDPQQAFKRSRGTFMCHNCGTENDDMETFCKNCKTKRVVQLGSWGKTFEDLMSSKWQCDKCLTSNKESDTKCAACEAPRKGAEKQTASSVTAKQGTSSASIGKSGFVFGATSSSSGEGNNIASTSAFTLGAVPVTDSTSGGFVFGGTPSTPSTGGFSFGGSISTQTVGKKEGGFAFGSGPAVVTALPEQSSSSKSGLTPAPEERKSGGLSFGGAAPVSSISENQKGFSFGSTKEVASEYSTKDSGLFFGFKSTDQPENGNKPSVLKFGGSNDEKKSEDKEKPLFNFGAPSNGSGVTTPLGKEVKGIPATEPSSKHAQPWSNGDNMLPSSTSKVSAAKPFAFAPSTPLESEAPAKPMIFFAPASLESAKPTSCGGNLISAAESVAPAMVDTKPMLSFGLPTGRPATDSKPDQPLFPSEHSAQNEDRSKRRRDGDGEKQISAPFPSTAFGAAPPTSQQPAPMFSFGGTNAASATLQSGSLFNAPQSTSLTDKFATSSTTQNITPSSDGTTSSKPFGNGPTVGAFGESTSNPMFSFGNRVSDDKTKSQTTPSFVPEPSSKPVSSAPVFGGTAPAPSSTAPPLFGSLAGTTSSSGNPFGSSSQGQGQQSLQTSSLFGNKPEPAAQTTAFSFGSAPSVNSGGFGTTNATAPVAPAFGSAAVGQAAFGSASAPSSFGSTQSQTPGFGATPALAHFGAQPSTAAFAAGPAPFGSQSSLATFGSNPAPFGSTPAPAPGFSFGSTPQQPAASAPFGSTPAPAPAQSFGGFGGSSTPAPGGFGAAPQSVGSFGTFGSTAPTTPAMTMDGATPQFSLGTGGSSKTTRGGRRFIKARRPQGSRPA